MPSRVRELARRHLPPGLRRAAIRLTGDRISEHGHPRKADGDTGQAGQSAATGQEILEVLRRGGSLAEAVVAQVREDVAEGRAPVAVAVSNALARQPETADVGALAAGIVAFRRGFPILAWEKLSRLPVELWAAHAPEEYVRAGLALDAEKTLASVRELVAAEPSYVGAAGWLAMLGPVFAHGDLDLARALFEALDRTIGEGEGSSRDLVVNRDWLRPWVAESPDDSSAPAGRRRRGVVRDHGLRPPGPVPRLGQHRRPRPEHRLPGPPRAPREARLRRTAGPRRPVAPAAGPRPPGATAGRRRGEAAAARRGPGRLGVRRDPAEHLDPCLRLVHARASSTRATASRSTRTCCPSSSPSTAASATC